MNRQEANDARAISFAKAEMVAFVCECADDTCRRSVQLSPWAFISRREAGESIVCHGHAPAADEPMAREREEAEHSSPAEASTHLAKLRPVEGA
jgi:hypothetical protein